MAEEKKDAQVRCPECGGERKQFIRLDNAWRHTFQMGAGSPQSSEPKGTRVVYQCLDCEKFYTLAK